MELGEALQRVDELKTEIEKLRPLRPEVEARIMQKLRLDWNYHSNAIEGNSLTKGETRALLLEGLTANGKPIKDHDDIRGHNELIAFLEGFIQRKEILTEAAIREMHKILLVKSYKTEARTLDGKITEKWVLLGEYKTTPNFPSTPTGETRYYAPPEEVAPKMGELVAWYRRDEEEKVTHPLIRAVTFHHRFLAIHPFDDGNGRLGRILMNLILMQNGYPLVVIKTPKRDGYIAALRKADVGELSELVCFVADELTWTEELYLKGARGESIEDYDDVDKEVALLKLELAKQPPLIELNAEVQKDTFERFLFPFFARIDAKLAQFDSFFAKTYIQINETSGTIRKYQRLQIEEALRSFYNYQHHVGQFTINWTWEGFQAAGPNDSNEVIEIQFSFYDRKFLLYIRQLEFRRGFVYGTFFFEDDAEQIINKLAKRFLDNIKQWKRAKE